MNPTEDIKIDKFNLDEEASKVSHMLYQYDEQWHYYITLKERLEAQIKNIEDELKTLRQQLFIKLKKSYRELGYTSKPTDKEADAWPYGQEEYKRKFQELLDKRLDYADAKTNHDRYQNFHYQLLNKSKKIELLYIMWAANYFIDSREGNRQRKTLTDIEAEDGTIETLKKLRENFQNAD